MINRDVLIEKVLGFKYDFFQFIDYINSHDGAMEFPFTIYVQFYNKKILSQDNESLKNILSLDNLLAGGVFTHHDKVSGMLVMSKVVYDLLVFLDVSRNKELSHAKFESLRQQTEQSTINIMHCETGSQDYRDQLNLFWDLISEILTTVKENIRVLHHKVDDVANQYGQFEAGQQTHSINELYETAQQLHDRHIKPCLEFINPDIQLVNRKNFVESIDALMDYYRQSGHESIAIAIRYKLTAITSYYKDIESLSNRLLTYLYSLAEQRRYFMAIEQRYNALMQTFENLYRHGGQKNLYLTADLEDISDMRSFDGLSSHKLSFSAKFDRHPGKSIQQFKHYFEEIQQRPIKQKVDISHAPKLPDKTLQSRKNDILKHIASLPKEQFIEDIHQYLDNYLKKSINEYTLVDVLYGLEFYLSLIPKTKIRQLSERRRVEDGSYYWEYRVLTRINNQANPHMTDLKLKEQVND
ncbi:hypothetical protein [Psychrobacter sp.]|uniref:hypothetical protein n=1 Tax=Psychrobacter sp. TaxID=56811 RepID=UPI003C74F856|tara:strand:- start:1101 stop:2504 length:1404 start_codon:yes stop_codon:yes gene_type:complete